MHFCRAGLLAALLLAVNLVYDASGSVIYVTNGDSSVMQAYDLSTGNQVFSAPTFDLGYPLAVRDSVWLGHRDNAGATAREYDLNGNATGATSTMSGTQVSQLLDGTTDGRYNYAINWNAGEVYRANLDWSGMEAAPMFTTPFSDVTGITYDSNAGSIWLSNDINAYEYDMSGTLLSSFVHNSGRGGLAYDGSSDTLWFVPNDSIDAMQQFTTDGTFMQSLTTPARSGNIWGAEIAFTGDNNSAVPEPATVAIWSILGVCGLGYRASRQRRK